MIVSTCCEIVQGSCRYHRISHHCSPANCMDVHTVKSGMFPKLIGVYVVVNKNELEKKKKESSMIRTRGHCIQHAVTKPSNLL